MSDQVTLKEGELISYQGENWKIVHAQDFERVLAQRIRDDRLDFLPIPELRPLVAPQLEKSDTSANQDASVQSDDQHLSSYSFRLKSRKVRQLPAQSELTPNQINKREQAVAEFQEIQKILQADVRDRGRLITEFCDRFGCSQATAYRRVKLVEINPSADVLVRSVRSDKNQSRLTDDVLNLIRDQLNKHRFIPEPKTLPKVLGLINGRCRKEGWKEISLTTLRLVEQETPLKKKLEQQGQKKRAADAFRTKAGHLPNNDYPLAIIQVDHTPIQVCLVDEVDRLPIGDAWLSLVIDTYSRMVLGFYLTFDAPSTLSTGLALAHAFLPKEEYLRSHGVVGEWPCWGFPDVILVDNATELNGTMMHGARRRYRFTLRDRPVGAPNFGGHVESAFKTFMYELKSLPGTKFSNPVERGEYDSEGRAIFTLREFEALFTEFLVNEYHVNKHTGEGMSGSVPLLKWKQGIFEGDVMPPTGLPDRPSDPLKLRLSLMPFKRRTVRNGTIKIFDEVYHSGAITLVGDQINLKQPLEDRKFEIRYDPRDIFQVWFYSEVNDNYITVPFADMRKARMSLWELNAMKRRIVNQADRFKDQRYDSQLKREEMKETAAKRTKRQRLENEKSRRRAEGSLVQPSPIIKTSAPSSAKKALDPERLKAMREKVRPAEAIKGYKGEKDEN